MPLATLSRVIPAEALPDPAGRADGRCGELTAELAAAWACAPARWRSLVRHVAGERWYVPLFSTAEASGWLITWAAGTGLELHDHGDAAGTIAVVAGDLTERHTRRAAIEAAYGDADVAASALATRRVRAGSVTTFASDHIHEVRNDGRFPAVTIHVYAPRLDDMAFYDAADLTELTR